MVFDAGQCLARQTQTCWDGSIAPPTETCPPQSAVHTCWDGSLVHDEALCPAQLSVRGNSMTELCGRQYRQETIYYEFDKGTSGETSRTINRILDIATYCDVEQIRIVGHADSSGTSTYNLNLSRLRAKDARDEFIRQGIAGERIASDGKGRTEPLIPTGDGVKEQLNRRTEVLIILANAGVIADVLPNYPIITGQSSYDKVSHVVISYPALPEQYFKEMIRV